MRSHRAHLQLGENAIIFLFPFISVNAEPYFVRSFSIGPRSESQNTCLGSYAVYKTRVGLALHQRTCAECTRPHSESVAIPILPDVHITIVPILHDNYGLLSLALILIHRNVLIPNRAAYLIVDGKSRTCLAVDPAGEKRCVVG
jgi:hypothetical protein